MQRVIKLDIEYDIETLVEVFKEEINNHLIGIYLHGSLAMGCFNPDKSDIDLLIVTKKPLSLETNKRIVQRILTLHDNMLSTRRIEFSILLESGLQHFIHPTPFELHYSDYHREKYKLDESYICGGFEDADLAAHIMVTYHRGKTLYGKAIRDVFPPIDEQFYIQSILLDVKNAVNDIRTSPVYFTLNLCRVLFFLKEGFISSKKEGGKWGLIVLPPRYHKTIQHCLDEYAGVMDNVEYKEEQLVDFAIYMLNEIQNSMSEMCI
jgi:predicted nucleotidyltransferase